MAADPDIGIVGGGTAGLHLALLLQQRGVGATLYAERSADEVLAGRLANTVAHHHRTRARERELGVNHWDETGPSYGRHWHYFGGEQPLAFPGDFGAPSLAVDYRIYQSRLLEDFEERGGSIRFGAVDAADAGGLSSEHDLLVVCTGRGGWSELFPAVPGRSLDGPRRLLSAGLYTGIAYPAPLGVTFAVSPGHGELVEIPLQTFEGNATTLLFETHPGGDLEVLARTPVRGRSGRLRAPCARQAARALPAGLRAHRCLLVRSHASEQHRPGIDRADRQAVHRDARRRNLRDRCRRRTRFARPAGRAGRQLGLVLDLDAGRGDPGGRRPSRRGVLPAAWTSGGFPSCSERTIGRTS